MAQASIGLMQKNVAYLVGIAGMAAFGLWIALHRSRDGSASAGTDLSLIAEPDEDRQAEIIAFYRPALEAALSSP